MPSEEQPACCVALVTAPDMEVARALASIVLTARLAACANLIPGVESHYWWQGKLETSAEVLMVLKTTKPLVEALKSCVLENHPYDTPEFVVLNLVDGSARYLDWVAASVKPPAS